MLVSGKIFTLCSSLSNSALRKVLKALKKSFTLKVMIFRPCVYTVKCQTEGLLEHYRRGPCLSASWSPIQQHSVFLEKFKTWPLHTRIYYNYMKRPAVAIGTPFYNWGRDYYAVGEDHVNDFKKQPIRSEL